MTGMSNKVKALVSFNCFYGFGWASFMSDSRPQEKFIPPTKGVKGLPNEVLKANKKGIKYGENRRKRLKNKAKKRG